MEQRDLGADYKAGMLNKARAGKAGYDTTAKVKCECEKQVRTVAKGKDLSKNFDVYAMTGPSTKRNKAPQLPGRRGR